MAKVTPDSGWWYLSSFRRKAKGQHSANALRRFLIHLNIESEGLHIVEHILLRPSDPDKRAYQDIYPDFFPFRISVIFPSWTARCHDPNFRLLAEETVSINCPAHVHPEFYWLDFKTMYEFEVLYKKWLDLKCQAEAKEKSLDLASLSLIEFLAEHNA